MSAVLRITADPADIRSALSGIVDEAQRANRRLAGIHDTGKRHYTKTLSEEQRAAIRAANEKLKAEKDAAKKREQAEVAAQRKIAAAIKQGEREVKEAEKEKTRAAEREARDRAQILEREARQAAQIARARARQIAQIERDERRASERQARNDLRYHQQQQRQGEQEQDERRSRLRSAGSNLLHFGVRALGAVGDYGDEVRERQTQYAAMQRRATELAAGDIGDTRATGQLMGATERISRETGINPEDVLGAMARAQQDFSALGDPAQRMQYLNEVLPQLAHAAVATGTSLEQMVGAAGEFQRQFGVTGAQLPTAIAQAIASGRLGSITFKDTAQYMGAIGGRAARFLSSNPNDALGSLAATNALFQTAGTLGGGGAESATRVRSFLDNLTSGAGQNRLKDLLGHSTFDRSGQIQTRQGESQTDALARTIEEAYAKSGGSADAFLTGIAGNNVRSRALGDALLRDLRSHGGRLTDFRTKLAGAGAATVANTIEQPYQAVEATEDARTGKRDIEAFYNQAKGNEWARNTKDTMQEIRKIPVLGSVLDNSLTRGALDLGGMVAAKQDPSNSLALGSEETRRGLIHNLAQRRAANEYEGGIFETYQHRDAGIQKLAQQIEAQLLARDARRGVDSNQPVQLAANTTIELGPRTISALRSGSSQHDAAVKDAENASGSNAPPPEYR